MRHAQLAWLGLLSGLTAAAAVPDIVWREQERHASWTSPSLVSDVWDNGHSEHGGWWNESSSNTAPPSVHMLQSDQ